MNFINPQTRMATCDLNKSFEEHISILDEIDDTLRNTRRKLVSQLIINLQNREQDWDNTFRDLLNRSQEVNLSGDQIDQTLLLINNPLSTPRKSESIPHLNNNVTNSSINLNDQLQNSKNSFVSFLEPIREANEVTQTPQKQTEPSKGSLTKQDDTSRIYTEKNVKTNESDSVRLRRKSNKEFNDPTFSNHFAINEFIRIQSVLNDNRSAFTDLSQDKSTYKNDLNIFIRTHVNAISNSDHKHLDSKIKLFTDLFRGARVPYQGRSLDANGHPQAISFCMDAAAQSFVTVGVRLVNSAPAIATSMASIINGIANNNFPIFRDLVIGNLQERCPFIIPVYPDPDELGEGGGIDPEVKYKIACGYLLESKTQTLENDEKYMLRMRSIVLIYASILVQNRVGLCWSWLASFLSLYPESAITATVLQAFLQETSKKLSLSFGRHYAKLLTFIKNNYVPMIEDVTPKASDRQSITKLKNLLSDL